MKNYLKVLQILYVILYSEFNLINGEFDEFPIVRTNKGLVRGTINYTLYDNRQYFSFKGIPYATPPLNELRFKSPQVAKSWKDVRNAFEFGNICIQPVEIVDVFKKYFPSPYITGDEDCLYLNVYTPNMSGKLAVMIFIHGGLFSEGSSNIYGPDFLVAQNIILVTINFRLGPFGFLSLGTHQHSGNMGLKDSLLAIRWVNENIRNFGGDPNQITIVGQDTGATLTHLLATSKASKYLFQRAIMKSGSMLNMWGVNERKDHVREMVEFAHRTDPSVKTMDDLVQFLQNVNATYLIENFVQKTKPLEGLPRKLIPNLIWSPIVKVPYDDYDFLIKTGQQIITDKIDRSTIDTMFTYNSKESMYFFSNEVKNPALLQSFNDKYEVQLPLNYNDDIRYNSEIYKRIAKEIHDLYFGTGVLVDGNTMSQYIDLTSDTWIRYGVDLSSRIQEKISSGKTYLFEFSVDDQLNTVKILYNLTLPGACVADDLAYLFRFPFPDFYDNVPANSTARRTIKNVSKIYANFVKYGNPFIKNQLKSIQRFHINFFNITNEGVIIGRNHRTEAMTLWDFIYSKYYKGFLQTNIVNG